MKNMHKCGMDKDDHKTRRLLAQPMCQLGRNVPTGHRTDMCHQQQTNWSLCERNLPSTALGQVNTQTADNMATRSLQMVVSYLQCKVKVLGGVLDYVVNTETLIN